MNDDTDIHLYIYRGWTPTWYGEEACESLTIKARGNGECVIVQAWDGGKVEIRHVRPRTDSPVIPDILHHVVMAFESVGNVPVSRLDALEQIGRTLATSWLAKPTNDSAAAALRRIAARKHTEELRERYGLPRYNEYVDRIV